MDIPSTFNDEPSEDDAGVEEANRGGRGRGKTSEDSLKRGRIRRRIEDILMACELDDIMDDPLMRGPRTHRVSQRDEYGMDS